MLRFRDVSRYSILLLPFLFQLTLLSFIFIHVNLADESIRAGCQSATASQSCSNCIKRHADCAWCADPHSNISSRCDLKAALADAGICGAQHIYTSTSEVKIAKQNNLPLDSRRPNSATPIQLEPQQVEIRLKPGDVVEVSFQYLHREPASGYEVRDFTIQTSEFGQLGLQIDFVVDCHGKKVSGRVCPGIMVNEQVTFTAKISLRDCSSRNIIAVSIGIYGYNTVAALFVTPLCDCECENPRYQEKRSVSCNYRGVLACGTCACDSGYGGDRCECDLRHADANTLLQLQNQCRENSSSAICSGKGKCNCGRCVCDADYIRGRFCECDSGACPLSVDGHMCSAHGECRCGKCACEPGYAGDNCACTDDQTPCSENGVVCSGRGFCECGKCACNAGWTGATCSVEQPQDGDADSLLASSETSTEEPENDRHAFRQLEDRSGDVLPAKSQEDDSRDEEKDQEEDKVKPERQDAPAAGPAVRQWRGLSAICAALAHCFKLFL